MSDKKSVSSRKPAKIKFKLSRKAYKEIKIDSPESAGEVLRKCYPSGEIEFREYVIALFLNAKNEVMGYEFVSVGGPGQCFLDPITVYQMALTCNARGIIISHNHPSGSAEPSQEDYQITKKINEGCKLLGLRLMDHIIITTNKYYSFKEEGFID